MRFTAQLLRALHLGMIAPEIAQEVADRAAVMTSRVGTEGNTEGINIKPEKLIDTLLGEIEERYPENLSNDNVTLMILRANGAAQTFTWRDKCSRRHEWRASHFVRSVRGGRTPSIPD
jgi:hypothetical protein